MVFGIAIALRAGWAFLVLSSHSPAAAVQLFPDSYRYHALAMHLLGRGFPLPLDVPVMPSDPAYHTADGALLFSGPGYPMLVASVYAVCGAHPLAVMLLQMLLSAASCVILARVAFALTGAPRVGTIAGLFSAASLTCIVLSAALLTETVALFLILAAADAMLRSMQSERKTWSLAAGALAGLAVLVKPAFQPLIAVAGALAALSLIVPRLRPRLRVHQPTVPRETGARTRSTLAHVAGLSIPVLVIALVCAVNYRRHGVAVFAANGPHSLCYGWVARAQALSAPTRDIAEVQQKMGDALRARMMAGEIHSYAMLHREDVARFVDAWRVMPAAMIQAFGQSVMDNCTAPDDLHRVQAPILDRLWIVVDPLLRRVVAPMLPVLFVLAAVILWIRKPSPALAILFGWYALFAFVSGIAFWQGSRYMHPALPAVWIVLACLLDTLLPPTAPKTVRVRIKQG